MLFLIDCQSLEIFGAGYTLIAIVFYWRMSSTTVISPFISYGGAEI